MTRATVNHFLNQACLYGVFVIALALLFYGLDSLRKWRRSENAIMGVVCIIVAALLYFALWYNQLPPGNQ